MYVLQERFIKFFFLKANYGSAKHLNDLGQLHEHPGRGVSMTTAVMPGLSWNSEESYMYYSNKNLQASRTIFHEQKLMVLILLFMTVYLLFQQSYLITLSPLTCK